MADKWSPQGDPVVQKAVDDAVAGGLAGTMTLPDALDTVGKAIVASLKRRLDVLIDAE